MAPTEELLARYQSLDSRDSSFVVEGRWNVEALIGSKFETESVLLAGDCQLEVDLPPEIPCLRLPKESVSQLVGYKFHRGALAIARRPQPLRYLDWLERRSLPEGALVLVAVGLANASNLGTIIRSAAAFGCSAVLVPERLGADPFSRKSVRASSGALFRIPVLECPDLAEDLQEIASTSTVLATSLSEGSVPLHSLSSRKTLTHLVMGPEKDGLGKEWLRSASEVVHLPMASGVDSLNVATAAAVFLYALTSSQSDRDRQ
ncbi:MAG: RNA methyltransferase [Verrucomicrobiota bacterium JB023]|nr:RNA methyltransferase [Verrucomicrobiota bacterium JB023]